jgi:hypothetical protein
MVEGDWIRVFYGADGLWMDDDADAGFQRRNSSGDWVELTHTGTASVDAVTLNVDGDPYGVGPGTDDLEDLTPVCRRSVSHGDVVGAVHKYEFSHLWKYNATLTKIELWEREGGVVVVDYKVDILGALWGFSGDDPWAGEWSDFVIERVTNPQVDFDGYGTSNTDFQLGGSGVLGATGPHSDREIAMVSCKTDWYAYVLAADSDAGDGSIDLGAPEDVCDPDDMSINRPMIFHWNRESGTFVSVSARMIVGVDSDLSSESADYTAGWDWAQEGRTEYCDAVVTGTAGGIDECSIGSTGGEPDSELGDAL